MAILLAHDLRLEGDTPLGWPEMYDYVEVKQTTKLATFLSYAKNSMQSFKAQSPDLPLYLAILSHGDPGALVFCNEDVHLGNVARFSVLEPYVDRIDIYGCGVARIGGTKVSDGNMFCSRLAQVTRSSVRAST